MYLKYCFKIIVYLVFRKVFKKYFTKAADLYQFIFYITGILENIVCSSISKSFFVSSWFLIFPPLFVKPSFAGVIVMVVTLLLRSQTSKRAQLVSVSYMKHAYSWLCIRLQVDKLTWFALTRISNRLFFSTQIHKIQILSTFMHCLSDENSEMLLVCTSFFISIWFQCADWIENYVLIAFFDYLICCLKLFKS